MQKSLAKKHRKLACVFQVNKTNQSNEELAQTLAPQSFIFLISRHCFSHFSLKQKTARPAGGPREDFTDVREEEMTDSSNRIQTVSRVCLDRDARFVVKKKLSVLPINSTLTL
jgi:hypothetical protein